MAAQKPSQDWPRRTDALNGNEDLLRQNPVGDASSSPKEERIPVDLILDYVLENIPDQARIVSGSVAGTTLTLTRDDASTVVITGLPSGGAGVTIEQYNVSNGSTTGTVWATGLGITITEDSGAGEITFAIPEDVELISANLFMPSSVTDGGAYHIVFDYVGARGFNTTKQNLKIPLIRTGLDSYASASRANPANISENGGNSANTVTYGVSSFGGGDGSDLEMSLINFSIGLNQMCRIDFI